MFIETYRQVSIHQDPEEGYYGSLGLEDFGYCDTIEAIREEIDGYHADEDAMREIPLDTPCLDDSFHRYEMEG